MKVLLSVLVAVLTVLVAADAANSKVPVKSAKATREIIENYEEIMPVITKGDNHKPYPLLLTVTVPTKLKNFTLVFHMNQDAVPTGFTSMYYDHNGKLVKDMNHYDNCYYHGTVEGHPEWTATMAACHGLQGGFGVPMNREEYYHIEPLDHHDSMMEQVHVVYKDSEYKIPQGHCGSTNHSVIDHMIDARKMNVSSDRIRRQTAAEMMEWVVVNDHRQFEQHGSNLTTTVQRAIAIANDVDAIYNSNFGIRIVLINSITFTNGDRFTVVNNSFPLLNSFTNYVDSNIRNTQPYDSIMLLTGIDLNTFGIAFIGTMCRQASATGVTQDGGRSLTSVVTTAAHELGHIFNMGHDTSSCNCTDPQGGCIMSAVQNHASTVFSSCSRADLQELKSRLSVMNCLTNSPSTPLETPTCGNGILEGTETCDCGEPAYCTNPCCNANTCQLSGAQCTMGECCNTTICHFLSSSTVCRSSTGECDIQETCTGTSGDCPADVNVVDGTPCLSKTGYCIGGRCPTHAAQCLAAWNSGDGYAACYSANRNGDQGGNCGHTTAGYIPCTQSDIRCGQLQCRAGTYQNIYTTIGMLFSLETSSGTCSSYFLPLSSDEVNPGHVQEGTKCAEGRICQAQACQNISSALNPPTCPTGSNGMICSGSSQGICNSLGQCTCLSEFVPPYCESAPLPTSSIPTTLSFAPPTTPPDTPLESSPLGAIVGGAVGGVIFAFLVTIIVILLIIISSLSRRSLKKTNGKNEFVISNVKYDNGKRNENDSSNSINSKRTTDFIVTETNVSYLPVREMTAGDNNGYIAEDLIQSEDNQAYHVSNVLNNIYDECDITPANHNPLVATESSVTHGCRGNVGESEMSENETNVDYSYVV